MIIRCTLIALFLLGSSSMPAQAQFALPAFWKVKDACASSPTIGTACADGTVYAGITPDGNVPMYVMPCDLGMSGTKGACTGTAGTYQLSTTNATTSITSKVTGRANTAAFVALGAAAYPAPATCTSQTYGGHTDWYLPAYNELTVISTNYAAIGGVSAGSTYWSSSENYYLTSNDPVFSVVLSTGTVYTYWGKTHSFNVRCARH